jgi:outer membrane autotransporter protein
MRVGLGRGENEPTSSDGRRGAIARRRAILLGGTAAVALAIAQPASAVSINDQVAAAVGGVEDYYDANNQYPTVVAIHIPGNGANGQTCSGTLINSRTILTAAHCFYNSKTGAWIGGPTSADPGLGIPLVSFAPADAFFTPNRPSATSAFANSGYESVSAANDIAVISLPNPVTAVRPVPLAGTIPAAGTMLTFAGYGNFGTGSNCCQVTDGNRRVATIEFGAFGSGTIIRYGSADFLLAQFRDPQNPNSTIPNNNPNNVFNLTVPTSTFEGGTVSGDSGGPVFIMTANGLVQIGELSGGGNPAYPPPPPGTDCNGGLGTNPCKIGLYSDGSAWTPLGLFLQWLAENNPLRQVAAAAGNFTWSNPAAWMDAVFDPARPNGAAPSNTVGNVADYQTQVARYYNVTLSNPGTITLDMSPQIDALSIVGTQSQLVIGAPYTLQVLLNTTLAAGTLTMLSGGTLTTGTYTQTGGLLQFQLAPGGSGRITVANIATLGGALDAAVTPGLYGLSTPYTLITAGAISGRFAQFISSPPSAFLSLSGPSYTPTSVNVTLTRTPFGAVAGLSANQRAVGNALEGAYATTLTGAAATLYTNLLMTGTPEALSQLSGEGTSAAQNAAFASGTMFGELLRDQGTFWRSGETADGNGVAFHAPLAYAAEKKKPVPAAFKALKALKAPAPGDQPRTWRLWTGGFGGVQSFDGDASVGSADARTAAAGGAMGFDYQLDPTRLVGFAVGASDAHFSVAERATSGNVLGGHLGAYGVATSGALYATGVLGYSRFDNNTTRTIAGVGPSETATGSFASDLLGARLEIGRSQALSGFTLTPFAAVQTATLWQRGFTETSTAGGGPGILGLTYQPRTTTSLPTFLGLQFDTRLALANGTVWSPFVRAAWVHEFMPDRAIAGSLVSVPGTLFAVEGARAWSDALKLNAGARLALNPLRVAIRQLRRRAFRQRPQLRGPRRGEVQLVTACVTREPCQRPSRPSAIRVQMAEVRR